MDDFLKQAATDIISLLTTPPSTTNPSLQAGDTTKNALLKIAKILQRAEDLPSTNQQHPLQNNYNTQLEPVAPSPRVSPSPRVQPITIPLSPELKTPTIYKHAQLPPKLMIPTKNTKQKPSILPQPPPPFLTNWQKRFLCPTTQRMKRKQGHERFRGLTADYLYAQSIFMPNFTTILHAQHIFDSTGKNNLLIIY